MNEKLTTLLGTKKRKAMAIGVASALVLTMGATTVFAANAISEGKMFIKNENGIVTHSTDDGASWSEDAVMTKGANGETFSEEGSVGFRMSGAQAVGGKKLLTKNIDGVVSYSTDDGATWSSDAPEDFEQRINEDGTITQGIGRPPVGKGILVKNENGVITHSTDGGETWTDGVPEDFEMPENLPAGGGFSEKSGSISGFKFNQEQA